VTVVRAAVVLALVMNGAAAVAVTGRLAPGGDGRRRLLVGAGALAAALLAGAAAVSGPVRDALDVGVPSTQISAGALVAVGAVLVLVEGSWGDVVADGAAARPRRGLVVPLTLPVLAGPGPLAVAVALAGRWGTATAVVAVALAAAATVVLAAALDRVGARHPWAPPLAARLVAAGAVAAAVELAVDGVLGV
jgi:small neutral amino acid transporter SnatA (MarC family)